ncbi:hypothetical protein D9M68_895470 [compost metagenome]
MPQRLRIGKPQEERDRRRDDRPEQVADDEHLHPLAGVQIAIQVLWNEPVHQLLERGQEIHEAASRHVGTRDYAQHFEKS